MKGKIIAMVGISGSGKSTISREKYLQDPEGSVIINRDKLREMLFGYIEENVHMHYKTEGTAKREKLVSKYQQTTVYEALSAGKTVILDETHLERKYLENLKYWNVPVEIYIIPADFNEAVRRDSNRNRKVGKDVIAAQYSKYKSLTKSLAENPIDFTPVDLSQGIIYDQEKPPCIIFDIDGTIALKGDRSPFDWHKVDRDEAELNTMFMLAMVQDMSRRYGKLKLIICTGRDEESRPKTMKWLEDNGIQHDAIYFRKRGSYEPDWKVKQVMWENIMKDNYIVGMFDDRLQVVRRARALGFKVFNVEYNNF